MTRCLNILANPLRFSVLPAQSRHPVPFFQSLPHRQKGYKVDLSPFGRLGSTIAEYRRIEYNWVKGVESLEDYRPGDKLGFGGYSTVWLARDIRVQRYVALKINTANSLQREAKILKALSAPLPRSSPVHPGGGLISVFLDEFKVRGPNGEYTCYTMAPAQCNLREISFSRLFPLEVGRALSYGLAQAVAYTHSQGYIHGDIHLSNILIKLPASFDDLSIKQLYEKFGEPEAVPVTRCDGEPLPPNAPTKAFLPLFLGKYAEKFSLSDAHVLLSDFGEAFAPATETRLGRDCHTPPAFRAPEAKFESQNPLGYASDIWSLATAIWEIIGMKAIFSTDFVHKDEIVSQHVDVLGPMPSEWWQNWEGRSRFFDEYGCPTESHKENRWPSLEESFEIGVQKWRRRDGTGIEGNEIIAFLDLMRQMLSFRPEERPTAEVLLKSEWMVKWTLPDFKRSFKCPL
ncbi:uncharacterized protein N7459_006590 [Penicillium hispanicum]|uniref:uncharacterized protein n=1 Tax=Penicillium hispanicum TaxID=1080232 RepID=UPI002541C309|nr:uncharacterized protein N7459_006590 [Penicillium hispanicum]KAJ5577626.1 hypothetical protein N7459_006590 [Penicillium hispanicum]